MKFNITSIIYSIDLGFKIDLKKLNEYKLENSLYNNKFSKIIWKPPKTTATYIFRPNGKIIITFFNLPNDEQLKNAKEIFREKINPILDKIELK